MELQQPSVVLGWTGNDVGQSYTIYTVNAFSSMAVSVNISMVVLLAFKTSNSV